MVEPGADARANVVVLCTDANFFLPCAFLVEQLAKDPERDRYDIAIAHKGVPQAQLTRLAERAGRRILTIPIDAEPEERALHPTYFRLLLHKLLPAQYRRILYLDSDIYIERFELGRLFDLDLGDAAFAAARCGLYVGLLCPEAAPDLPHIKRERDKTVAYLTGLGLDLGDPYLNGGVLLIDRARWTALDIPDRAMSFALSFPERCMLFDQSAINAVGRGQWAELSPRWNFQGVHVMGELDDAIRPVFRHFAGPYKPWNTDAWGPELTRAYHDWLAGSGWSGGFPAGPSIAPTLVRKARKPRRWWRRILSDRRESQGKAMRAAAPEASDRFGPNRRAAVRHAVTSIATFARFVDLDAAERSALVKAVVDTRTKPARAT